MTPEFRRRPLILFTERFQRLEVTACSQEALGLGIAVGMPLGEAKSMQHFVAVRRADPRPRPSPVFKASDVVADRDRLRELAQHCQCYSPLAGLEEHATPECLWLEISGNEALFGGELGLVETVRDDFAQQGFEVRIAIAETWGTAWGVSHYADRAHSIVPSNGQAAALGPLPVEALRIPQPAIGVLHSLDVTTVSRLMMLPRASLPSRFGKELLRRLDQALGLVAELLTAERLVTPIRVEWLFEEPVSDLGTLHHVCGELLDRVLGLIEKQQTAIRELTWEWLGTVAEPTILRLLSATRERKHLLELLRLHFERTTFASGVTGVRMEVLEVGLPPIRQRSLFVDDRDDTESTEIAQLVDRLSTRMGPTAVVRSSVRPDPLPEGAIGYVPWLSDLSATERTEVVTSRLRCRPLRLLRTPQLLAVEQRCANGMPRVIERSIVKRIRGPERIEAGWWRASDEKRDYFRVELANGTALWVFVDRVTNQWFLHGFFA